MTIGMGKVSTDLHDIEINLNRNILYYIKYYM
jgi:hypothetical protein